MVLKDKINKALVYHFYRVGKKSKKIRIEINDKNDDGGCLVHEVTDGP